MTMVTDVAYKSSKNQCIVLFLSHRYSVSRSRKHRFKYVTIWCEKVSSPIYVSTPRHTNTSLTQDYHRKRRTFSEAKDIGVYCTAAAAVFKVTCSLTTLSTIVTLEKHYDSHIMIFKRNQKHQRRKSC